MGKWLRGCLGEGGEGVGPNMLADGNSRWKGVGEVRDAVRREVGQRLNSSGELKRIDGDELGNSNNLGGAGKSPEGNDEARRA